MVAAQVSLVSPQEQFAVLKQAAVMLVFVSNVGV